MTKEKKDNEILVSYVPHVLCPECGFAMQHFLETRQIRCNTHGCKHYGKKFNCHYPTTILTEIEAE